MPKCWVGLSTTKDAVTFVDAEIPDDENSPIVIVSDDNWKVQTGDRAQGYSVLHQGAFPATGRPENPLALSFPVYLARASVVFRSMSARSGLTSASTIVAAWR